MSVIPGKYIDGQGRELTVVGAALHGVGGDPMVIYRAEDGGLFVLTEEEWAAMEHTYAGELALRDYLSTGSRAELTRRLFGLFATRDGVYSVHWRGAVGGEGYNYACENHSAVAGCYRGIDNCKNCHRGRLAVFSAEAVEKHLRGEQTVGVYPVTDDGRCRFLVFGPLGRGGAEALGRVCRDFDVPFRTERLNSGFRLWIFFAEPLPLARLRQLGDCLISRAMETSSEIGFDMYDKFLPCRDEIMAGDLGFELRMPFGGADKSVFVDENFEPLPHGAAEIFRVPTVTRGYLADRLKALGDPGPGLLWKNLRPTEGFAPSEAEFDGMLTLKKAGMSHSALLYFKRLACVRGPRRSYGQFEETAPSVTAGFSENVEVLRLPRGLRPRLKLAARALGREMTVTDKLPKRENVYFTLLRPVGEEYRRAAELLAEEDEGIFLAPQGWGKTAVVARLIEMLRGRVLILVADETTRLRWERNVLEYFGVDAGRSGAKIHVRLADDRRIKDRYDLVILADCSRLPMDAEIFTRLLSLTPRRMYGITASASRRDGLWDMIALLCGDVVNL